MNNLVIGGTRFFGIHMVNELLTAGYDVTIATRGKASDSFGDKVKRIFLERTKEESVREALSGTHYDVVIDKIAYCSNDIKYVMDVIDCDKYIYMSSTSVYNPKHINTVEADFDGIENELIWCDRKAFPYMLFIIMLRKSMQTPHLMLSIMSMFRILYEMKTQVM